MNGHDKTVTKFKGHFSTTDWEHDVCCLCKNAQQDNCLGIELLDIIRMPKTESTYAAFILLCWASAVTKIRFQKAKQ